jgi:CheY-like chemotaxis protein
MPGGARGPEILYVDDDRDSREMYSFAFRKAGWHVKALSGGAAALQFIRAFHPRVVITDIRMTEITGYDVCRAVRENPPTRDMPVIALTALERSFVDESCFTAVLWKPCTPDVLVRRVAATIGSPAPPITRAKRAQASAKMPGRSESTRPGRARKA